MSSDRHCDGRSVNFREQEAADAIQATCHFPPVSAADSAVMMTTQLAAKQCSGHGRCGALPHSSSVPAAAAAACCCCFQSCWQPLCLPQHSSLYRRYRRCVGTASASLLVCVCWYCKCLTPRLCLQLMLLLLLLSALLAAAVWAKE
jgi:hypothetical protein